jgi:hypothetical protein
VGSERLEKERREKPWRKYLYFFRCSCDSLNLGNSYNHRKMIQQAGIRFKGVLKVAYPLVIAMRRDMGA